MSSNLVGTGDSFSGLLANGNTAALTGIVTDGANNQAIVGEALSGKFFRIDLTNGNRTLITSTAQADTVNIVTSVNSIVLDDAKNILFLTETRYSAIFSLDAITGQRVIFSKAFYDIN